MGSQAPELADRGRPRLASPRALPVVEPIFNRQLGLLYHNWIFLGLQEIVRICYFSFYLEIQERSYLISA